MKTTGSKPQDSASKNTPEKLSGAQSERIIRLEHRLIRIDELIICKENRVLRGAQQFQSRHFPPAECVPIESLDAVFEMYARYFARVHSQTPEQFAAMKKAARKQKVAQTGQSLSGVPSEIQKL